MEAAQPPGQSHLSASRHCAPTHVSRKKASVTRQVLSWVLVLYCLHAACIHTGTSQTAPVALCWMDRTSSCLLTRSESRQRASQLPPLGAPPIPGQVLEERLRSSAGCCDEAYRLRSKSQTSIFCTHTNTSRIHALLSGTLVGAPQLTSPSQSPTGPPPQQMQDETWLKFHPVLSLTPEPLVVLVMIMLAACLRMRTAYLSHRLPPTQPPTHMGDPCHLHSSKPHCNGKPQHKSCGKNTHAKKHTAFLLAAVHIHLHVQAPTRKAKINSTILLLMRAAKHIKGSPAKRKAARAALFTFMKASTSAPSCSSTAPTPSPVNQSSSFKIFPNSST